MGFSFSDSESDSLYSDTSSHLETPTTIGNGFDFQLGDANHQETGPFVQKVYGIDDLDNFLKDVYKFYQCKGYSTLRLKAILQNLQFLFFCLFVYFIGACMDYHALFNEHRFHSTLDFRESQPASVYMIVCAAYWAGLTLRMIRDLHRKKKNYSQFKKLIELRPGEIKIVTWATIEDRLIKAQEQYKIFVKRDAITSLDIKNRILRNENYMIAMCNMNLVPNKLYNPFSKKYVPFFPKSLEYTFQWVIFSFFFDKRDTFKIKPELLLPKNTELTAYKLQVSFMMAAILLLVGTPVITICSLMYYFFRYAEKLRRNPALLSGRSWSPYFCWKTREYNELPHIFKERLNRAHEPARLYLASFRSESRIICAKFVSFVVGSILAVILILTIYDEEILSISLPGNTTVLWYVGIFGVVLACAQGMIPDEKTIYETELYFQEVIKTTQYVPETTGISIANSIEMKQEIEIMFEHRLHFIFKEILGVLLAPYIYLHVMPRYTTDIVKFMQVYSEWQVGVGHVFKLAQPGSNNGDHALHEDYYQVRFPTTSTNTLSTKEEIVHPTSISDLI